MINILTLQIYFLITISILIIIIHSFNSHNNKIHPLILISILLCLLIISSFHIRLYFNDHFFSFLIFLIIVGGIIIIFLYFIRFINNIKTSIKSLFLKNYFIKILLILTFSWIIFNLNSNWLNNFNEIIPLNKIITNSLNNLNYLYIYPKNYITLFLILFILFTLTIIVKICLKKKISLRKINYEKIHYKSQPNL